MQNTIQIYTLNVDEISIPIFKKWLITIPQHKQNEVKKYMFERDQKFKLFGILIVKQYCKENNISFEWENWQLDKWGKPFLTRGPHFNISHSVKYIVVAFANQHIGIDIELVNTKENVGSINHFLHPKEQVFVNEAADKNDAFFEVWTRKEAYLKAKGVGMSESLNKKDCSKTTIEDESLWYLNTWNIFDDYKLSICTSVLVNATWHSVKTFSNIQNKKQTIT